MLLTKDKLPSAILFSIFDFQLKWYELIYNVGIDIENRFVNHNWVSTYSGEEIEKFKPEQKQKPFIKTVSV